MMDTILAVDDRPDNLVAVKALLQIFLPQCKVITANSGQEGLQKANAERPDTILLDIHMPEMDGFTVCRALKNNPVTAHIPVIMLTALRLDSKDRIKALDLGADAFLTKPINEAELAAQVKAMLRIKKAEDQLREKNHDLEYQLRLRIDDLICLNKAMREEIRQHKKTEQVLQESEQRFKRMFEQAPLSYQSLDEQGNFMEVNSTWLKILGYEEEEVLGRNFSEFLVPEWQAHFRYNFPQFKTIGEILGVEFEMIKKDGSTILVSFHGKISRDKEGAFARTHCVFHDISNLRSAENRLKKDLELHRAFAGIARIMLSDDYNLKEITDILLRAAKNMTGSSHGFVSSIDMHTGENIVYTLTDTGSACQVNKQDGAFPMGQGTHYEGLWGHALNTKKPFFTNMPHVHPSAKGLPDGHIMLENFLALPVVAGDQLLGMIALANTHVKYTDEDLEEVGRLAEVFAFALHREGYEMQRKDLERSLRQLQKNEAIGELAGGIAHDFNNILSPIIGYSEIIKEDMPLGHPSRDFLLQILGAAHRAKDLVKQILTFSRQNEEAVLPMQVHPVVKEVIKLMKATIPSSIEIQHHVNESCPAIMADPTQIHQIIMNLMTNAYHAMMDKDGRGTLSVHLTTTQLDSPQTAGLALEPGSYVVLTVQDTGVGIAKAVMEKIFDPYFTTKPKDKGTGLGLSVVYGLVKQYKGDIKVETTAGTGSTFRVYLPTVDHEVLEQKEFPVRRSLQGHEHILVVDDEEALLALTQRMLERVGYTVNAYNDSRAALAALRENPKTFDLVITDMTMPGLTGDQITMEVKKLNPSLPVLICTGFSAVMTPERARLIGAAGLMMKPVVKRDFLQRVRDILDGIGLEG